MVSAIVVVHKTARNAKGSKNVLCKPKQHCHMRQKNLSRLCLNGAIDPVPVEDTPYRGLAHSEETGVRSISVPLL